MRAAKGLKKFIENTQMPRTLSTWFLDDTPSATTWTW